MRTLSDKELCILIRNDRKDAFSAVFECYSPLLLVFAHRKLNDKEEAKDVVQEIFADLWYNREHLDVKSSLSSYLYQAAIYKILNIFRHRAVSENYLNILQEQIHKREEIGSYLEEKEVAHIMERAISNLPPKMQEVFCLRKNDHLSNREIAQKLSISEHTVATHMKRALSLLRKKLNRF